MQSRGAGLSEGRSDRALHRRLMQSAGSLAAAAGLLVGAIACREEAAGTSPPEQSVLTVPTAPVAVPRLEPRSGKRQVLFAGCAALRRDAGCELERGAVLTVWVGGDTNETFSFHSGGQLVPDVRHQIVAGGLQFRVQPAAGVAELRLDDAQGPLWRLRITTHDPIVDLERAEQLRQNGQIDEALALVNRVLTSATAAERNRARALAARVALKRGDHQLAAEQLAKTSEEAWALGRISDALRDALALSFIQIVHARELERARETLSRIAEWMVEMPSTVAGHRYYSGLIARRTGELGEAEQLFQSAAENALRINDLGKHRDAVLQQAQLAADLGRPSDALTLVDGLVSQVRELPACVRAPVHATRAWILMLAKELGEAPLDLGTELEAAAALGATCGDAFYQRNDLLNLGFWALDRGRVPDAERHLAALRSLDAGQTSELLSWEHELRGRVALAQRKFKAALAHFSEQAAVGERYLDVEARLRADVGRGEALEGMGRMKPALEAFGRADALLSDWQRMLWFGAQKDGFVGRRDAAARHLVHGLLRMGQRATAFSIAARTFRRAFGNLTLGTRIRALPEMERREWRRHILEYQRLRSEIEAIGAEDWRLTQGELALRRSARERLAAQARQELQDAGRWLGDAGDIGAPDISQRAKELLLLIFPDASGWLLFARWQGEISVQSFPHQQLLGNPNALGPELLAPLRAKILRAQQLSVVPYGAAQGIDFAALPFESGRLLERVDVVYRLGLGASANRELATVPSGIVGDPNGDLPQAREEARLVAQRLGAAPGATLLGEHATRENVLHMLGQAAFFHYAGHGEASTDRELRGLPLAGGNQLLASDILALPRVPPHVVLAACDAGRSRHAALAGGWSLAHAFVVAGASEVVAPVRSVPDIEAAELQTWLYENLLAAEEKSLARALGQAQRRALALGKPHWQAFRAFAP